MYSIHCIPSGARALVLAMTVTWVECASINDYNAAYQIGCLRTLKYNARRKTPVEVMAPQ